MNSSTRRLVYSSLIFAVTTLCANADPIRTHRGNETVTAIDNTNLHNSGTLVLGDDITQTSFSESHNLTASNTIYHARVDQPEEVSMITPSVGKVQSTVTTHLEAHGSASPAESADFSTTDSIGPLPGAPHDSATPPAVKPDSTDRTGTEVRTANDDAVDSPDPSAASNTEAPAGQVSDSLGSASTPEPSTMVMAGSMFIGFGLLKLRRKKRG